MFRYMRGNVEETIAEGDGVAARFVTSAPAFRAYQINMFIVVISRTILVSG